MKMNVRIIVAALSAVGLIAPVQQALADTITPPAVTPPAANPNPPTIPATNTVTYPVTVTLPGGSAQTINFTYNSSTGTWTTRRSVRALRRRR